MMSKFIFFREVIQSDSIIQNHFISYLFEKIDGDDNQYFNIIFEKFFTDYIHDSELSLSKTYKLIRYVNDDVLTEIMLYKDFPTMKVFTECIPEKISNKKKFTLIEGLSILKNYGLSKKVGVNDKHRFYMTSERAKKQSIDFTKKDLNGLLGVSGLFKKTTKKPGFESHSVWTVKK